MSHGRLKIGEIVPITYNSYRGDVGVFVQATLVDDSNTVIDTVDVPYTGNGLYRNTTKNMPATLLLAVKVNFYRDAAFTILDTNYQELLFVYLQADVQQTPGSISVIERIEGTIKQNNRLSALLKTSRIQATIAPKRIKATIKQQKIFGRIKQQNRITGLIKEC